MKLIKHYDFVNMTSLHEDWTVEVGDKWSNKEVQRYRNNKDNLYFDNGLVLKATYQNGYVDSARLKTKHKFSFKYGKIDILAKIPSGKGTWPALWMMPEENTYGHWPKSGEIDIMEHCGNELDKLFLCIHTEAYNHTKEDKYYQAIIVPKLTEKFQLYSLLWDEEKIVYYLNNKEVGRYVKGAENRDATHKGWPFDQAYYLIINLAIGGTFGGKVDYSMFPQSFIVKDIKVYQQSI